MLINKSVLCIIPARSGSKGLPNKNTKLFLGKPLISWSIEQALSSKFIDKVIVSTDDIKIIKISRKYGACVPFIRPKYLANSSASTTDVILHALNYMRHIGSRYDIITLLQPTSPLRTTDNIDEAIGFLKEKKTKSVVSLCEAEHSPLWANVLPINKSMKNFLNLKIKNKNRQALQVYYRLNGAIYASHIDYFIKNKGFFSKTLRRY